MDDFNKQKEDLAKAISDLKQSLDPRKAKKLRLDLLERVAEKLILHSQECKECEEFIKWLITCLEDNRIDSLAEPDLAEYQRNLKSIVSHMQSKHKLFAEGYYLSTYMCIGLAIGTALGAALKNIAMGVSLGIAIGVAVGACIEADYRKKGLIL